MVHRNALSGKVPVRSAVVLCGGAGSRLGAIGWRCPKCLLRVGGRPILFHHLTLFETHGVSDIYLSVGHLAEKIMAFAHKEIKSIRYHIVQASNTGTGGAILRALEGLPVSHTHYWISMGDILCIPDLVAMYDCMLRHGAQAVLLGVQVPDSSNYGVLVTDRKGVLVDFREKQIREGPALVDAGFYLFSRSFLYDFSGQQELSLEYEVFPRAKDVAVVEHNGFWYDIGNISRLKEARRAWSELKLKEDDYVGNELD